MSEPVPTAEKGLHRIVSDRHLVANPGDLHRYTCACSITIDAHPELLDEAFAFHVSTWPKLPGGVEPVR